MKKKMNVEIIKRIMSGKNYLTIAKKPRLEKSQGRNWKKKKLIINTYLNEQHHRIKKLIYAGVKLVCAKIGVPLKNTIRNSKPGWEIQLETQIRNLR